MNIFKKQQVKDNDNIIPIFFAIDDNYAPYLGVALRSLIDNASKDYLYKIYVLNTKLTQENYDRISALACDFVTIEFVNVTKKLDKIGAKLHLRDYYSKATYYRFFISSLFPQYKKALYLDCDIIVLGDISEIYNTDLKENYAGAVQEEVMATVKVFGDYVEQCLGIACKKYFNAGVLLINLEQFRKRDIENEFVKLLSKHKFAVTQDQDYLNVLCKDKMTYFHLGWNKTPILDPNFSENNLKLIHYKIAWKPWHYDDVLFGEYFWKYAKDSSYYEDLMQIKENYSDVDKKRDSDAYDNLVQLAITDCNNPNNYKKTLDKQLAEQYLRENFIKNDIESSYLKDNEIFSNDSSFLDVDSMEKRVLV